MKTHTKQDVVTAHIQGYEEGIRTAVSEIKTVVNESYISAYGEKGGVVLVRVSVIEDCCNYLLKQL